MNRSKWNLAWKGQIWGFRPEVTTLYIGLPFGMVEYTAVLLSHAKFIALLGESSLQQVPNSKFDQISVFQRFST